MNSHWGGAQYADKLPWIRRLPKPLLHQLPQVKELKEDFAQLTQLVQEKFKRHADRNLNKSQTESVQTHACQSLHIWLNVCSNSAIHFYVRSTKAQPF